MTSQKFYWLLRASVLSYLARTGPHIKQWQELAEGMLELRTTNDTAPATAQEAAIQETIEALLITSTEIVDKLYDAKRNLENLRDYIGRK